MLVRVGRFIGRGGSGYVASPSIQLSGTSIAEDAAGDTVIGTASVANAPDGVTYTWAITADPDSKFAIDESTGVLTLATEATLNFEDAQSHLVTIAATPSAGDPPPSREFTIIVTNVIEAPVNVTPPAVTGSLEVGSTLSCSTGTWTDMGAGSFAYQWKDAADDSNIDGETASTLVLTHALIDVSVYCIVTATNAADSTAQNSNTVGPVVDTTAPVLSSASAAGTGLTTASAEVSTNEANGTLYVVVTTSATQPTAAQIKLGDDHADADAAFADSAAVSATGAQTPFSVTGLTHTTDYWAHFIHEDAEGNQSEVVTAAFETDAATVPDAFEVGDWSIAAGDEEADVTISGLPADGGDTITDIEYRVDGGSPVSSGTDDTTGFTIPSLTNDQEYDVQIRAVNSVGAGAWSDTKQVTPEAAGGSWHPTDLASMPYAIWDPTVSGSLWQNSDGTGAVSDGDPLGRIDDQSTNGNHALQATSTKRPTFDIISGVPWIVCDGVDDGFNFTNVKPAMIAAVYYNVSGGSNIALMAKEELGSSAWNDVRLKSTTGWAIGGTNTDTSDFAHNNGVTRVNGVLTGTTAQNTAEILTMTPGTTGGGGQSTEGLAVLGLAPFSGRSWKGRIGRVVLLSAAPDSGEYANLLAWLAAPYGISV